MQRYEYKVENFDEKMTLLSEHIEQVLNDEGNIGWELVDIFNKCFIYKRELENDKIQTDEKPEPKITILEN